MSDGTLNQKGARTVFSAIWEKKGDNVDALIETLGLKQISDTGAIEAAIDAVLAANPKMLPNSSPARKKLQCFGRSNYESHQRKSQSRSG